ncbi:Glutathione-dependent formaldehyde-activating enzyme [Nitrosomonas cryotolerans]|uniref:Glutathione-dependent formaldehyde-activating enzyme n=1 Tax=Nitrosomonas cryotolerans ATCC 49181 TaxID=1131553 RepID=A0A1N6HBR9_9PROT|nr:GFA family protein [Nitrosomonas cryotolerans]SFP73930.1 Glutathione-dependent formaldehyde-activating enzyme [Nitrosomonas cryotolerans]SIO17220.1 Glutathione-dependent formaldehyde-activating enzyme [Nitrosomonas cryotolerans ATCC 49181]
MIYKGSCHCGAITFEVEAPEHLEVKDCNCSICVKSGFLHLILPLSKFKLNSGADKLETYTFNTNIAKHTFCRICGIKPFYVPRSNPDGIDVNVRCLDMRPKSINTTPFDGKNWEKNVHQIIDKSEEVARNSLNDDLA